MMKTLLFLTLFLVVSFARLRVNDDDIVTAGQVDLDAIVKIGTYYNIVSKPDPIDLYCHCSQVVYTWITKGTDLNLSESCRFFSAQGKNVTSNSEGVPIDSTNSRLINYNFHRIAKAPYDFVQVAEDYSWLAVGMPNRKYFWLLSAKPTLDQSIVDAVLKNQTLVNGYDFTKYSVEDQSCHTTALFA